MLVPALLGGLFVGVLSALPVVNIANCCCLWIFTGGALAAHVLQQNEDQPIGAARGAVVGLMAGAVGAFVWLLLTLVLDPLLAPLQERMISAARGAGDMPSEVREWFDLMGERAPGPIRYAVGFFFQLFLGLVFSTIGGLVGSAVSRPPAAPVVPPPLPPQ